MSKKKLIYGFAIPLGGAFAAAAVFSGGFLEKKAAYEFQPEKVVAGSEVDLTEPVKINEKMESNTLIIESLGIRAPVMYAERKSEDHYQDLLQYGVVHYPGTALPGGNGNAYIFGHSSDYAWAGGDYKTVFALLPDIDVGTFIIISDDEGNKYVYKAREKRVIAADDFQILEQDTSKKMLTLQTSYPIGTALKRFVVISELVN